MKNIINYGDRRLVVLRIVNEMHKPNVDVWKEHLLADTVLKKNGNFYFCHDIKDAEILEEWTISDSEKWLYEHKQESAKESDKKSPKQKPKRASKKKIPETEK